MIEEQKKLLFFKEKESAWREMAKQVAHEIKNPLTPMKLLIQNFERKFDKNDPDIDDRVKKLCASMVDQIDLMAKVAGAFSEFTKLPEKKNEVINVNNETAGVHKSSLEAINYEDVMPDLEGMSPQEVLAIFKETDIDIEVSGTGLVKEQKPAAGDSLKNIKKVKIILE